MIVNKNSLNEVLGRGHGITLRRVQADALREVESPGRPERLHATCWYLVQVTEAAMMIEVEAAIKEGYKDTVVTWHSHQRSLMKPQLRKSANGSSRTRRLM